MRYRCSASVVNFRDKLEKIWGLREWEGIHDEDQDVLFFGLYIKWDFDAYWMHEGKKTVFWCGSDIINVQQNWEWQRRVRLFPEAKHYCENEVEQKELAEIGIESEIVQSFLDDIDKFPVSFKPTDKPHIFMSGHPNREEEYGFSLAMRLAERLPDFTFHLYGAGQRGKFKNIIIHGQVPEKDFNEEIKNYHCGLRPNDHDGFSEIVAKSVLMGQYPISFIPYKNIWTFKDEDDLVKQLEKLKTIRKPNKEGRNYWRKNINKFPWVK